MEDQAIEPSTPPNAARLAAPKGSLLRKYISSFVAVVGFSLAAYTAVTVWFSAQEHRAALVEIQRVQAESAAFRISQFAKEIERQLRWVTHLQWSDSNTEQHRIDALRLLRQMPAITDLTLLDGNGRERLFISRVTMDRADTRADRSNNPDVRAALEHGLHYGAVYFRRDTEPFMRVALAGVQREAGVVIAEVNLSYMRDVVSQVRIGREGKAYVVDKMGRLIAHPDASLVLRKTDLSSTMHLIDAQPNETLHRVKGVTGEPVLLAQAPALPLDWRVLVELPQSEADEPWHRALARSLGVTVISLCVALGFAVVLAWRMVEPIRLLKIGAQRIGSGQLNHRILIDAGDEVEELGHQFNKMADALERSYATLERKVEERTKALTDANRAKSGFLQAASHDLRQPLHALNLLVAQLRTEPAPAERARLTLKVESTVASVNGLFDGLLDISKLEAGVVDPAPTEFSLQQVLNRVEATFAEIALAHKLKFHVRPHSAWVLSDPVLLERILDNLVSNALRYTKSGGVLVGCRRCGETVRVEVWDTGIGIPQDKHNDIFVEFFQMAPAGTLRGEGLGLGLAIVARLGQLLGHPINLASRPGRGSRFSVTLAEVAPQSDIVPIAAPGLAPEDILQDLRLLIIDNDLAILESTAGLMRTWGCEVITAPSMNSALQNLGGFAPSLVIADIHLDHGEDGIFAVAALRQHFRRNIPAVLVSGDVSQQTRDRASLAGLVLLEKPVTPMRFRTVVTRSLQSADPPASTTSPGA